MGRYTLNALLIFYIFIVLQIHKAHGQSIQEGNEVKIQGLKSEDKNYDLNGTYGQVIDIQTWYTVKLNESSELINCKQESFQAKHLVVENDPERIRKEEIKFRKQEKKIRREKFKFNDILNEIEKRYIKAENYINQDNLQIAKIDSFQGNYASKIEIDYDLFQEIFNYFFDLPKSSGGLFGILFNYLFLFPVKTDKNEIPLPLVFQSLDPETTETNQSTISPNNCYFQPDSFVFPEFECSECYVDFSKFKADPFETYTIDSLSLYDKTDFFRFFFPKNLRCVTFDNIKLQKIKEINQDVEFLILILSNIQDPINIDAKRYFFPKFITQLQINNSHIEHLEFPDNSEVAQFQISFRDHNQINWNQIYLPSKTTEVSLFQFPSNEWTYDAEKMIVKMQNTKNIESLTLSFFDLKNLDLSRFSNLQFLFLSLCHFEDDYEIKFAENSKVLIQYSFSYITEEILSNPTSSRFFDSITDLIYDFSIAIFSDDVLSYNIQYPSKLERLQINFRSENEKVNWQNSLTTLNNLHTLYVSYEDEVMNLEFDFSQLNSLHTLCIILKNNEQHLLLIELLQDESSNILTVKFPKSLHTMYLMNECTSMIQKAVKKDSSWNYDGNVLYSIDYDNLMKIQFPTF